MAFVETFSRLRLRLSPSSLELGKNKNTYRVSRKYHFKVSSTYRPFFIPFKTYVMNLRNVLHILAKDTKTRAVEPYRVSRTHGLSLVKWKSFCPIIESTADNPLAISTQDPFALNCTWTGFFGRIWVFISGLLTTSVSNSPSLLTHGQEEGFTRFRGDVRAGHRVVHHQTAQYVKST